MDDPIIVYKPLGRVCVIEGCESPVDNAGGKDMCCKHYQRWRKHGDPSVVGKGGASLALESNPNWSGDDATYAAVHLRLRRQRGRADQHSCVDCGKRAAHWSYPHTTPTPGPMPYSVNLSDYEPRCASCHRRLDNAARLLTGERP